MTARPYIPALPDWSLSWLAGKLGPAERRALRAIVQEADVIEVDGQRWLLAPLTDEALDALIEFESEGEDREPDLCDEPCSDREPPLPKICGGPGA